MITQALFVTASLVLAYSIVILWKLEKISSLRTGMLMLGNLTLLFYILSQVLMLALGLALFQNLIVAPLLLAFTALCFLMSVVTQKEKQTL